MDAQALAEARRKSLAVWDEMAAGWQRHNDYLWEMSRPVGEWLIERLAPKPGQTILDIAAGPGDTGFGAAKLVGEEGRLISTDFSEQMISVARGRAAAYGVENAEFKTMDAERMDLPDDSVDGALCRWGFMLMLDPGSALKETRRVLKDGGRLVASTWAVPEKNPWITAIGMVMTSMGKPPQGDPFGPGGIFSMSEPAEVRGLLADAGFASNDIEEFEMNWRFDDFEHFWEFLTELAGAISSIIKEMPDDEIIQTRRLLEEQLRPFGGEGTGYVFPAVSLTFAAR